MGVLAIRDHPKKLAFMRDAGVLQGRRISYIFRTNWLQTVRKTYANIGQSMSELKSTVVSLVRAGRASHVWVPTDFATIDNRDAVDKTLQRLVRDGELRRIDRGLYDRPIINSLTKRPTSPDYRAVVDAIARRDRLRLLVDGMTAANDLGMTDTVPARVTIHTDARRRSVKLGNLVIEFKQTAPSRLYWADRPAMRVVQALHWLKDTLATDRPRILSRLSTLLTDQIHGDAIRQDLRAGFGTLPAWMQSLVRELPGCDPRSATVADVKRKRVLLALACRGPASIR